jgi:predicted PurR-regulated permease PerM
MVEASTKRTARRWTLNFVTVAFAIALALLFVLVLRSIAVQITPSPELIKEPYPDTSTPELCETEGGRWIERRDVKRLPNTEPVVVPDDPSYCQGPLAFEREREAQAESSQQTMLFVFAIGGALAVASSLLVEQLKPVAPGLMLGGIVAFFIAGIQIWMLAPGWGRLATIVAIFIALLGVGLYTLRDTSKD